MKARGKRILPRVAKVKLYPTLDPQHLAIAEAVRDACLPFTSMSRLTDVEHLDLKAIVITTLINHKEPK
jgi:hypothetical protein